MNKKIKCKNILNKYNKQMKALVMIYRPNKDKLNI